MSRKKDNAHNEVTNSELFSKEKGVFVILPNTKHTICEFGYFVAFHISEMNKKRKILSDIVSYFQSFYCIYTIHCECISSLSTLAIWFRYAI